MLLQPRNVIIFISHGIKTALVRSGRGSWKPDDDTNVLPRKEQTQCVVILDASVNLSRSTGHLGGKKILPKTVVAKQEKDVKKCQHTQFSFVYLIKKIYPLHLSIIFLCSLIV